MIEIYNEKVRDLLGATKAPEGGMQVREDTKRGLFYGNYTSVLKSYIHITLIVSNLLL